MTEFTVGDTVIILSPPDDLPEETHLTGLIGTVISINRTGPINNKRVYFRVSTSDDSTWIYADHNLKKIDKVPVFNNINECLEWLNDGSA